MSARAEPSEKQSERAANRVRAWRTGTLLIIGTGDAGEWRLQNARPRRRGPPAGSGARRGPPAPPGAPRGYRAPPAPPPREPGRIEQTRRVGASLVGGRGRERDRRIGLG